jgi:cell fate regulator YaaT (PSP1 superfamily)
MPNVIGVKFRNVGRVYFFDPGAEKIRYHDHVIVETARGLEIGTVMLPPTDMPEEKINQPLRTVLRVATEEDLNREQENRRREREAYRICKQKIAEHGLDMKLIEAEYTFDNSKVQFYFTADGRIDFRELVKDLAGIFRTRIELRQIGVRDETKLLGGIGICGRPLCCHTWLTDFHPVSIKMAKEQNLSLNPTKISGTCGRLMCCLNNEAETYEYLNRGLPSRGDYVTTEDGRHGEVNSVNILRQTVKVVIDLENDEKELEEFPVKDITFIPKAKRPKNQAGSPAGGAANAHKCRCPRRASQSQNREEALKKAVEEARDRERTKKPAVIDLTKEMGEKPEQTLSEADQDKKPKRRRRRNRHRKPQGTPTGGPNVGQSGSSAPAPIQPAAKE